MDDDRIERIYHYTRKVEAALRKLEASSTCTENKAAIREFCRYSAAKGIRASRIHRYIQMLHDCADVVGKPFRESTKDDIQNLVLTIERREYSPWTKRTYRAAIRIFYRWLRGTDQFPDEVRWIKLPRVRNALSPGDLLTSEDVERMIAAASSVRDKAMIAVLYDSACRPHEILTLRLKDVTFDAHGALLTVNGKTGPRTVRVIAAESILATWFNVHPVKSNLDAPLFPCFAHHKLYDFLGYAAFKQIIKEAATKAGITKRIYPYIFRHSRLTELARSGFVGYHLNLFAGWTMESPMPSTYIHLRATDVDDALLKLNGIVKDTTQAVGFVPLQCPRCTQKNTPGSVRCYACGLTLDLKRGIELDHQHDDLKDKIARLTEELAKSPEAVDVLLNAVAMLQGKKGKK